MPTSPLASCRRAAWWEMPRARMRAAGDLERFTEDAADQVAHPRVVADVRLRLVVIHPQRGITGLRAERVPTIWAPSVVSPVDWRMRSASPPEASNTA